MFAGICAQTCAQPFATRNGTILGWLHVRWWLETMRVQNVMNGVVGAMVQLLASWFLTMFVCQPASVIFVTASKRLILNCFDAHNLWHAIVERS